MSEGAFFFDKEGTLPWTKSCFVCGESNPHGLHRRSRVEGSVVVLDYTTRSADLGWRHLVHGGILMTLLDEVMTWAAILASREAVVAAEMTTRLKKPVGVGETLRVEGRVVKVGRKLVLTDGVILRGGDEVVGRASGKYFPMPGEGFRLCEGDFVSGGDALSLEEVFGGRLGEGGR